MKKLIRFLARISGVEEEIRWEEAKRIGGMIIQDSYWFSGLYYGETVEEFKPIHEAMCRYGRQLTRNKVIYISSLRDKIYQYIKQNDDGRD